MAIFSNLIEKITNRHLIMSLEADLKMQRADNAMIKAELAQAEAAITRAVNRENIARRELEAERHDHALTKNGIKRIKGRNLITPIEQVIHSAEKRSDMQMAQTAVGIIERLTFDQDMDWRLHTAHIAKLKRSKKRFKHIEAKLHARESELLRMGLVAPPK
jgi:hypothetical protein